MQTTHFSYPQWMNRIVGGEKEIQRMEEITTRYSHLLFSAGKILDYLSLDEVAFIGEVLENLPSSRDVLLAPYTFADLYLDENKEVQSLFNKASFPMQCKILDTARLYRKAAPPHAMIALDWESGSVQLLALSATKKELKALSLAFLTDPLTLSLVDECHEAAKAYLLSKSKALLLEGGDDKQVGVYEVTCSDELFVNKVLSSILDATFTLVLGEQKDRWDRAIPEHIREADEVSFART